MPELRPHDLIGARADDPEGLRPCPHRAFLALPRGMRLEEWDSHERLVRSPPQAKAGPYTELKLAATPARAVGGLIMRRRANSSQTIRQVVGDALTANIFEFEAHGVRIQDRQRESTLVEGIPRLRAEGTGSSLGWMLIEGDFERGVVGVAVPDEAAGYPDPIDCSFVASIPRLTLLREEGALRISYRRGARVRLRDLLRLSGVAGNPGGGRFATYLARELARDLLSPRNRRGLRDWGRFAGGLLAFLGGVGGLVLLLSEALSALF